MWRISRRPASRPDTLVPLTIAGSLSLRSWLDLLLEADKLTFEQDDKGLVIRRRKPGAAPPELSAMQRPLPATHREDARSENQFRFQGQTVVAKSARFFESKTEENFVLSPRDRKAGLLDPKMTVTGSAKDVPLREALNKLLDPLGVEYTIRDEVIVLTAKPKAASRVSDCFPYATAASGGCVRAPSRRSRGAGATPLANSLHSFEMHS